MNDFLSANTQAILLLTAPLNLGRSQKPADPLLTPREYEHLARHLLENERQPADLLGPNKDETQRLCREIVAEDRMERLLGRGYLLAQAVERWRRRAIWVISRADYNYPRRLKQRLGYQAPAVLYGCGDPTLLDAGGLAVVGSRAIGPDLLDFAASVGELAARSGKMVVSGGAKGSDQAAMAGALQAGGRAIGVLADSLERAAMNRENRTMLLEDRLVLISPYDPNTRFFAGFAMQRNKLIYALAGAALVVNSDVNKGGTWAGAVEQLEKHRFIPVYVRATGRPSPGLDALRKKGALPWPNPSTETFSSVFTMPEQPATDAEELQVPLGLGDRPRSPSPDLPNRVQKVSEPALPLGASTLSAATTAERPTEAPATRQPESAEALAPENRPVAISPREVPPSAEIGSPAELLFETVREVTLPLLESPKRDAEVASALGVSASQARAWLQRLVEEDFVEKKERPVRYTRKRNLTN